MFIRQVKTENGWVRGIQAADPRITAYKGIPFAAPPVGENRWRAPQPCPDWEGVLDCYTPENNACMVFGDKPALSGKVPDEVTQLAIRRYLIQHGC